METLDPQCVNNVLWSGNVVNIMNIFIPVSECHAKIISKQSANEDLAWFGIRTYFSTVITKFRCSENENGNITDETINSKHELTWKQVHKYQQGLQANKSRCHIKDTASIYIIQQLSLMVCT